METNIQRLQRQQMILKFLGYYTGACDGIWSEKTIAAKRAFEVSGKFSPAYPNHGMPFDFTSKLPSGIMLDYTKPKSGLLTHVDIPTGYYEKLAAELVKVDQVFDPTQNIKAAYDPLMADTVRSQTVEPRRQKVEPVEVIKTAEAVVTENVEQPPEQNKDAGATDNSQVKTAEQLNANRDQNRHHKHPNQNHRPR
jgi:hypothetical protein